MDKKLMQDTTNKMFGVIANLSTCSAKKCGDARKKMMENKNVYQQYLIANSEIDIKKKQKLLNDIYKNKLVYDYNNCIFNNCKNMYKDLVKVFKTFIEIAPFSKENKNKINDYLIKIEKILKIKNISNAEINEILKYFIIIQGLIKS
jgi:hypothetical protein